MEDDSAIENYECIICLAMSTLNQLRSLDRAALRALRWFCPPDLLEEIEGDLLERHARDQRRHGPSQAGVRLWWNAIRYFRPSILMRNKIPTLYNPLAMFFNYLTVAWRNMRKRKLYTGINTLGLGVGITACMLIFLFIRDEHSFDRFHVHAPQLYRVHGLVYDPQHHTGGTNQEGPYHKIAHMQLGLLPAMKADIPEVAYASYYCQNTAIIKKDDMVFKEKVTYVDADFFSMFTFRLLEGNTKDLFTTKNEIALTPAMAQKYFGNQDAIGKVLSLGDQQVTVTAIVEEPPANSSLDFQILLPIQRWGPYNQHNMDEWRNMGFPAFVQLKAGASPGAVSEKVNAIMKAHMGEKLDQWREADKVPAGYEPYQIGLTPLAQVHFDSEVSWDRVSDRQYSAILAGIALIILAIACINYVCLTLTVSARRQLEMGIRKAVGAQRRQLIWQFCMESVVLVLLGMTIGISLLALSLPWFNTLTQKNISLSASTVGGSLAFGAALTLVIGLASGLYPALVISRFQSAEVMKRSSGTQIRAGFAKPLVVLQYGMAVVLMVGALAMNRQMNFVASKALGFDQHNVIVVNLQAGWQEDSWKMAENFRTAVSENPDVVNVSSTDYPFAGNDYMRFGYEVNGVNKATYGYTVDPRFFETLNIQLVEGRNFIEGSPTDKNKSVIVNEALVSDMGWKNPVGEHLKFHMNDTTEGSTVIGVVKDFNFLSLQQQIEPMLFTMEARPYYVLVKIQPTDLPGTVQYLQQTYSKLFPGRPFEFSFLDEDVARQYASFERWKAIMNYATGLAVLISCLGLFGLSGINAVNRTREIGIRKVMGANARAILTLLNKEFVILTTVAYILAAPVAWYGIQQWLSSFKYRIEIGPDLFLISLAAGLCIVLATISYHALKALRINPAEILKHE